MVLKFARQGMAEIQGDRQAMAAIMTSLLAPEFERSEV